jgi:uncharacterized protein YndB with AHSA1/START domain
MRRSSPQVYERLDGTVAVLSFSLFLSRLEKHAGCCETQSVPEQPAQQGAVTRVSRRIAAPREKVYEALLDPDAIARWRVPEGMRSEVHLFEPHEGGAFRVSLTYDAPDAVGKTSGRTDTYHGRFLALRPDEQIVEAIEFETGEQDLRGEMTITTTLDAAGDGTELTMLHEGLPAGVSPQDNETGTQMALAKLAAMLEQS